VGWTRNEYLAGEERHSATTGIVSKFSDQGGHTLVKAHVCMNNVWNYDKNRNPPAAAGVGVDVIGVGVGEGLGVAPSVSSEVTLIA